MVQVELDSAGATTPVVPTAFDFGLYTNDPLQVVIDALEDAQPLLTPLEETGYAAASSVGGSKVGPPSPADDDCIRVVTDLIGSIKVAAEDYDQNAAVFMESFQSAMQSSDGDTCGCTPATSIETSDWVTTCGDWYPSSGGIQTLGDCQARRHFNRNVDSVRTRTYTRICSNCDVLQCEQTQTRAMTDREYGPSFDMSLWACNEEFVPGNIGDPPTGVVCEITWFDHVFGDVDQSGWGPDGCSLADLVCP